MSHVIGAFVCPRGVFAVECRYRTEGLEIVRAFDAFAGVASLQEGASHLNRMLGEAGIKHATVAVAVRGFGLVHHIFSAPYGMPGMEAAVFGDLQQIDPGLANAALAWTSLAPTAGAEDAPVLAAGIDQAAIASFEEQLATSGHRLGHFTALPASMQRLSEEFFEETRPSAMVSMLPDGPFIAFSLNGVQRLVMEPAVPQFEALPGAAEVAEDAELGAEMFRQQFGGAHVEAAGILAADESYDDVVSALAARLPAPVRRLAIQNITVGGLAAVGAVLDSAAESPLRLAGGVQAGDGSSTGRRVAVAVGVATAVVVAIWAVAKYVATRSP